MYVRCNYNAMAFIEINEVSKRYEGHHALDKVSFSIPQNAIFGLLGPNGAGKTTLIRILNQITEADEGNVLFDGSQLNPSHIARIGYLPEERGLYKKMKVLEQLVYFGRLKDLTKSEAERRALLWLDKFDLNQWKYKKIEELSKGMAQKVQFILTVMHNPDLIILDEPFSGFDPVNTEMIKSEIQELRNGGATVLFSTHRMESVEEICDHVGMINKSKKVLEGTVTEVRNSFKNNAVSVLYEGTLSHPDYQGFDVIAEGGFNKVIITSPKDGNTILRELMDDVKIISYEEHLPSMKEIFINKVEN